MICINRDFFGESNPDYIILKPAKKLVKKAKQIYEDQKSPWNKYSSDLEKVNPYI